MGFLIVIAVGVIIGMAAYGISNAVYRRLVRAGNGSANTIRVVTFIVSFLALLLGIVAFILYNFKFER